MAFPNNNSGIIPPLNAFMTAAHLVYAGVWCIPTRVTYRGNKKTVPYFGLPGGYSWLLEYDYYNGKWLFLSEYNEQVHCLETLPDTIANWAKRILEKDSTSGDLFYGTWEGYALGLLLKQKEDMRKKMTERERYRAALAQAMPTSNDLHKVAGDAQKMTEQELYRQTHERLQKIELQTRNNMYRKTPGERQAQGSTPLPAKTMNIVDIYPGFRAFLRRQYPVRHLLHDWFPRFFNDPMKKYRP
jgi:hypothetical protein